MLKTRIMPTLLYKDTTLVKGVGFESWRRVGSAMQAVKVYNMREVDELVFLDITATNDKRQPDFDLIDDLADECFMPIAVGGGIKSAEDVRRLLMVGADKVVVNTAAVDRPEIVTEIAERHGRQSLVVSIDAKKEAGGGYQAYVNAGTRPTSLDAVALAQRAEADGAGEILITSIERDGTMEGYDLDLLSAVAGAVSVPVIASGGAGNYQHLTEALEVGSSALAAASIFHFTEQTPREAKRHLHEQGYPVRL